MKYKCCTALRVQFSSETAVIFPQGNVAFGNIIDSDDNSVATIMVLFASGSSSQRLGDCQVVRFGEKDSREPERISSSREIQVAYREADFILPCSAKVKCGGFKFGGKVITAIKQFIRSYEGV